MPTQTTYAPQHTNEMLTRAAAYSGKGVFGVCPAGQSLTLDLALPDDILIVGGRLLLENSKFGDRVTMQVVDKDGIAAPAGTVLGEYIQDWFVGGQHDSLTVASPYPNKVPAGFYLRVIYTSTGTTDVSVAVNYDLHTILF